MRPEDKKFLEIRSKLEKFIGSNYKVDTQFPLPYQIIYSSLDSDPKIKKFKTDILILKDDVPLAVIEGKLNNATTHDLRPAGAIAVASYH